jgi:hypothetical protein
MVVVDWLASDLFRARRRLHPHRGEPPVLQDLYALFLSLYSSPATRASTSRRAARRRSLSGDPNRAAPPLFGSPRTRASNAPSRLPLSLSSVESLLDREGDGQG